MAERYQKRVDRLYGVLAELQDKHGMDADSIPVRNVAQQIEQLESLISKRVEAKEEREQQEVEREAAAMAAGDEDFVRRGDGSISTGGGTISEPQLYRVRADGEYEFHDDYWLSPAERQERRGEAPAWDLGPEPAAQAGSWPCPCGCSRSVSSAHFVPEQVINHEEHGVSAVHEYGCGTKAVLPLSQLAEEDPARFQKLAGDALAVREVIEEYGGEK